ncbi:cation-translocating P-type ATPase [Micromonospora sp. NBC_00389]|uniref:cation-translocating P-type ATPase n=1 Tax=Micromonospora sp. NBC_00389 TaxID=2903586 RepID=UPI002E1CA0F3
MISGSSGRMTKTGSGDPVAWHAVAADGVATAFAVEPPSGLTALEVERRRSQYGLNRLAEAPREPWWRALLRQFQDLLIVILLVAAVVSLLVSREWETPAAIAVVVLLNATIGFVQESRAEASLEALRRMLVTSATVRRDGRLLRVNAEELVPGDVVVVEAGDRMPADARLLQAISLEVQESSLTGEAQPVTKRADADVRPDAALGDRVTLLFMNTMATRGRGEAVVTATGMDTEIGRVAGLLHEARAGLTPLQRQINALGRTLAVTAGIVIAIVFGLGLARGQQFHELFVTAVSLAVATIPEGLPAVVAFTLAMGTGRLARRGAIIKRLASVETLGSTSEICTDKTGTLTLNEMTAREMVFAGRPFTVSGEGYRTDGQIQTTDGGVGPGGLKDALTAMALCSDAVLRDDALVGDPTEGALVVLAEKGDVDVARLRAQRPRLAEVPFDADQKYMITFHLWTGENGEDIVRAFIKGAPDVLAERADRHLDGEHVVAFDDDARVRYGEANADLARRGLRVLAIGVQDLPAADFDAAADLRKLLDRVVLLALVGIVDPPRPEARDAIAACRDAGIRVRMITGDHAVTAAAIAENLGIQGRAVTGRDLDRIGDDDLADYLADIGVIARVSPAHKIRIVQALQNTGSVVAMTGDGVNDAPALRAADIGVAMGVTGTEVAKEASTMILTDDNFATIVRAVHGGRGIYDNIVNFTRFQVSTAFAFVITFLVASVTGIAGGAPFTALQILFVNLVMDGPPAMSLGVDPVSPDAMRRPPRPAGEHILNRQRMGRIVLAAAVMAAGTVAVLQLAPGPAPAAAHATIAGTMAFVTFVFFQVFNLLNVRSFTRSVFSRETLRNRSAFVATGVVVALLVLVVELDVLNGLFTTTDLSAGQWLACAAVGSTILIAGEVVKALTRSRRHRQSLAAGAGVS